MKRRFRIAEILAGIISCILLILIVINYNNERLIGVVEADYNVAASVTDGSQFIYLSDIDYVANKSFSGWKDIKKDQDANGNKIKVRVENGLYSFDKGMWAHATSNLVYDLTNYNYDYFTAYIGINATANGQGSVKFYIYTSADGNDWNLQTSSEPQVSTVSQNAQFVKINIKGVKYLKLVADSNGSNGNDHAVYADAKLIKEGYDDNVVQSVEELDRILKTKYANATLADKNYELALLQRNLINNVGRFALKIFLNDPVNSEKNKAVFNWLFNDIDNLKLYTLGGNPDGGSYINSLNQLSRLYDNYKDDFKNKELLNNKWYPDMTYGDLYKKMAITLSLTHSQRVALWMQPGALENQSDAVTRYQIYKDLHKNGKFVVTKNADGTPNIDITPWFEALKVEEMRFVLNNIIDDEEILWLNEFTQSYIDKYPNRAWAYLTPHPYMAYVWPNYGNPIFHDQTKKDYWDEKFGGIFSKYGVTYSTDTNKVYKVWMNFRNEFGTGAVCGGISKTGSNIRTSHGIPAAVIGQPGHAALIYYSKDAQGRGYWGIDNDVSGWTLSEKSERMLLGWGNASYTRGSYQVVYMALAQEVLNDYDNFEKCEETIMIANTYSGDLQKQEELFRKAIKIQPINIDAWYGLINVYLANENKTENDFYNLADELAESLKYFPLPMYQLTNLIKPKLVSIENSYRFTLLQTRILTEASVLPNNTADNYYVYQPSLTRIEANFLLGKLDKTIATFSFDGQDAGKIVLSSRFAGNGVRWDYSLDGKKTWKEVSFTAEEEHKLQLTKKQIDSITSENDIYVHIVGVGYEEKNLYKIDILDGTIPENIYANDLENRIVGVNLNTEWRYTEKDAWTSYSVASPDLTGNKTVQIRQGATGTKLTSNVSPMYIFTEDNQPDTRKYIPVSHLRIHSVSTEAVNNGGAAINAIDGNYNTRWHSAWNGTDTNRFIVIELDRSVSLSAVEFVPAGGGNGKIYDGTIYGSMDGENWEELANLKNLKYTNQANTIEDAIKNTKSFEIKEPKEVKYVKIVADRSNANWFTARAFNLYQDLTKNPHPTAGVAYSTTEPTNGSVVARLINPSTEIEITNNGGEDTYVFTENGEFTFEFKDKSGNTGYATAKVNWIDKDIPTADINYELNNEKKLVILLDGISEDVYLLDKNNNKVNYVEVRNGKVSSISYLDSLGKVSKVVDVDENGVIQKITYKNTTDKVSSVATYVTTLENGVVNKEEYFDSEGNSVTLSAAEKDILKTLQQTISNPLEYTFDGSGDYEFKFLDKASNIAYKSIKVDYIDNNTTILASDITYDITKLTNKNVVATIKPFIIDTNGKNVNVEIVNNNKNNKYTFTENGEFTFEYKDVLDVDNLDVKKHEAKVSWIDKIAPTAEIKYSTKNPTNNKVVVTLVNESEQITVTNNGSSREFTFAENGEFTFEFTDKAGNIGRATAKVDWIKKEAPVAEIKYSTTGKTKDPVTATIVCDEEIFVINNNKSKSYTFKSNGTFEFIYEDALGNRGKVVARVNWIEKDTTIIPDNPTEEPKPDDKPTIEYKDYSTGNISITIPGDIFTETVKFKKNSLVLTDTLKQKLSSNSEYFEVYFENQNEDKMNISSTDVKMSIKLDPNKEFVGIYEVVGTTNINPVSYKINNGIVELTSAKLGKYVISYKEEKQPENPEVKEPEEEKKNYFGWLFVIPVILVVGVIAFLSRKKNY